MNRSLAHALAIAVCLTLSPAGLSAKTFELPDEKPVVTLDLPNAWTPGAIDDGAQATSPDRSIYVAMEIANAKDTTKAVADSLVWFRSKGVKIDQSTQKKTEAVQNGLQVISIEWTGTDKDGPTKVSLSVFVLPSNKVGVLTFWGTDAGERKYAAQLKSILDSIQPLGE